MKGIPVGEAEQGSGIDDNRLPMGNTEDFGLLLRVLWGANKEL